MDLSAFDQLARRQHGVISFEQSGLERGVWRRALDSGALVAVHPNVARLVGTEPTELQRAMAASLAVPRSVVSHRTAAYLWGLVPTTADVVHLTDLSETRQRRSLHGVRCHRPRDRQDLRSVRRSGIAATPPFRTLLDLGITDPDLVHSALGAALAADLLTVDGVEAGLRRHSARGRHGIVALRRALDDWALDAKPADSVLELAFLDLCRSYGLPVPVFHERIEGWEVDFRFPGTPIIVECDGWTTHGRRRSQFESDRRKDDDLRAAGWIPARLTYRAITHQRADTARRVRRLLDRWAPHPAPDDPTATPLVHAA